VDTAKPQNAAEACLSDWGNSSFEEYYRADSIRFASANWGALVRGAERLDAAIETR
jgi:hypothetical protein